MHLLHLILFLIIIFIILWCIQSNPKLIQGGRELTEKLYNHKWIELPYKGCIITEARHKQLIKQLSKHFLKGAKKSQNPLAIVISGNPGVGKTSARENLAKRFNIENNYVLVNGDDVLEMIPEYQEGLKLKTIDNQQLDVGSTEAWAECMYLTHPILNNIYMDAVKKKANIVLDYPTSYLDIPDLKYRGYTVVYAYVFANGHAKRAYERALNNGRFIDPPQQMKHAKDNFTEADSFQPFVAMWSDYHVIINNSGSDPLIEEYTRDEMINFANHYYSEKQLDKILIK